MTAHPAVLVTGRTYPARRQLRALGGHFDHEAGGFVFPPAVPAGLAAVLAAHALSSEPAEVAYDPTAPETADQVRARRDAARRRRADRLDAQAATRDRDAEAAPRRHEPWTRELAFITEPIKVGHHSEGRHRRLRARLARQVDEEMRNRVEAGELRSRADHLRTVGAQVKGDAAARRAAEMEAADRVISPGAVVHSTIYGREATVLRVNRNTYTARFADGWTITLPKNHVTFVRQGDAAAPVRPFRKGQRVAFRRLLWRGEGLVVRVNPTGCSVEVELAGRVKVERFSDAELAPV